MSPIIRHGYRSPQDNAELARFYSAAAWKRTRSVVIDYAGTRCEWCGTTTKRLDCVHLEGRTMELIRSRADVLSPAKRAAGCRKCHSNYAAGNLGRSPGR